MESGISNIKKELTPYERQIVESIEGFEFLEDRDRVFLILVWRGLKIASPVSVLSNAPASAAGNLENIIKGMGLFHKVGPDITERKYGLAPGKIIFVANSEENANLISSIWFGDHMKDEKVYREIGRLSRFPQTAIDTYLVSNF